MALKEKISDDLKKALKKKAELEILTLRMLQAAILNKEKEKRAKLAKEKDYYPPTVLPVLPSRPKKEMEDYNPPAASSHSLREWAPELEKESQLTDDEVIEVISSEIKKRKEAIFEFQKGEREDLVEREKAELEVLKKYLPEQLSEKEIKKLAREVIAALRTSLAPSEREKFGVKDMGKVMGQLMPQVKGKAEGSLVSKIVKELLS